MAKIALSGELPDLLMNTGVRDAQDLSQLFDGWRVAVLRRKGADLVERPRLRSRDTDR